MNNYYEKTLNFFLKNKTILYLSLFIITLTSVLKQFKVTIFIAYFIVLFFLSGLLGLVKNEEKLKRKSVKRLMIYSLAYYDNILSNLIEFIGIYLFNVCVVGGLTVFPMRVLNIFKSETVAFYSLIFLCIVVFMYRIPIFVFSFSEGVLVPKESGKYAIIKIKEIIIKNNKIWIELSLQFFIYILLTFLEIKSKSIISRFFLEELKATVFLFFMVRNFYWYSNVIKDSGEYKKVYDSETYTGIYNSLIGRFFM